jgi:hypothetical protein
VTMPTAACSGACQYQRINLPGPRAPGRLTDGQVALVIQLFVFVTHLPATGGSVASVVGVPTPNVGSSTMPRPASRTFAFELEHIEAMYKAFDAACARLFPPAPLKG